MKTIFDLAKYINKKVDEFLTSDKPFLDSTEFDRKYKWLEYLLGAIVFIGYAIYFVVTKYRETNVISVGTVLGLLLFLFAGIFCIYFSYMEWKRRKD
ncbi:MAG: DUF4181 domain-containing protein [Bacteroidales bacterium]|jgi:uncharacterized membrane protein YecN with MAPEG domain|nr:DUF4181 domain-containing protein [Bacteroidales bacterium]